MLARAFTFRFSTVRTHHDLVEKVLDELLLEWPRCEQPVKIGTKQFRDEVAGTKVSHVYPKRYLPAAIGHLHILQRGDKNVAERDDVLVLQVLEQLQLAICPLGEHRGAEGLHDFLDGDILVRELVLGGAVE